MPDEKDEKVEETPAAKAEKEFNENALKLAKEQGLEVEGTKEKEEKEEPAEEKEEKEDEAGDEKEESEAEEELDGENLKQAKLIFKLLNNPNTALQALDTLARTAGYSLKELKEATKEEKKEISKSIKETVKEQLGTKIPFLSEELGTVLEEVISKAVKEQTKDIRETVEREANSRREAEMHTAFEKVVESYENVDEKIMKEIVRIQTDKEIIPGTMKPEKYFKTCVLLAADNLGVQLTKKTSEAGSKTKAPIKKEIDPISQLGGKKGLAHDKSGVRSATITTMKDAIEEAAKKLESQFAQK